MSEDQLSERAKALFERVKEGRFYFPHRGYRPAAMQELVDARLVTTTGRAVVIEAAYVPVEGYTPMTPEVYGPARPEAEERPWIVVGGDVVDGFRFYGPYDSEDAAENAIEDHAARQGCSVYDFHAVQLKG